MDPHPILEPIVARALELCRTHPELPALQLLDAAMEGHHSSHPDFETVRDNPEFIDWLEPPSPFAEIVRRAFSAPTEHFDSESPHWQRVIDAFSDRYHLWR